MTWPSKLLLLAALGAGFGSGCKDGSGEAYQVRVLAIDAHGGPALSEDRVRAIVRRSLATAPSLESAQRDQRSRTRTETLAAGLEYRELPDASDHGRDLMVRMTVSVPESLVDAIGSDGLDATVLVERGAGEADLADDLQLATDRLVSVLQARLDLAREVDGAVARLLTSSEPDLLVLTLEWIRDHSRASEAQASADRVAELIKHGDERVGLLAIETLGAIGGPQHVPALLERIQLADSHQVSRAYDALSRLGGPEAAGFLEFAARNEDEPDRRAAAQRALRRVAESDIVTPGGRTGRALRGHR